MTKTEKKADAIIEQRGHTLILTLNRPEARNALSTEMLSIVVAHKREPAEPLDGAPPPRAPRRR